MREAQDNDDLYGDAVICFLTVKVRRNGAMSTEGCIDDEKYALAMLDNAKDAIRAHHRRKCSKELLLTPAYDTPLAP